MAKRKQLTVNERLRNLERRVAELERIERFRQKTHRQVLRDLDRSFNKK